jgi:hypothetical protein
MYVCVYCICWGWWLKAPKFSAGMGLIVAASSAAVRLLATFAVFLGILGSAYSVKILCQYRSLGGSAADAVSYPSALLQSLTQ